jgi:glycosyl hydrolase family 123
LKNNNLLGKIIVLSITFILSVSIIIGAEPPAKKETIPIKNNNDKNKERFARKKPVNYNPHNLKEIPFIENNAAPTFSKKESQRGYLLFQRPITAIVYPGTRPEAHERLESIEGFATPGEFEPLTFSIYPERKLKNLRVNVSDLKKGNNIISLSDIDIRLETYWNNRYPKYTSKSYRKIPELLEKVTVHSSPAGECQRYWIILHVPDTAEAGFYTGNVSLKDDDFNQVVTIPIRFRVLNFKLIKDPNKHYGTYCYDISNNNVYKSKAVKDKENWIKTAVANDYSAMVDFGLDMIPTQYPRYNSKNDKAYFDNDGITINRCLKAGMKGPIPLTYGYVIGALYRKHTGKRHMSHWKVPELPPEAFYQDLTRVTKEIEAMRKKRGWPEFIYCPLDEVDSSSIDFGIKTYKAVKAAGVRIFITKHPTAADAPLYAPYVDIFCSQPFSVKYEKTLNSRHEYWSYPNHNSGETKIPEVRTLGGRMTYGFGFWRSGYTTLIPWIWRWDSRAFTPFNYLANSKNSPTGNMLDENGELITTPYWMCFREGYDDERYIYTLEKYIKEREKSKNPDCQKMVNHGKELLKKIWDHIPIIAAYKNIGLWPDKEFMILRWQLADAISQLLKYPPAEPKSLIPSVLPGIATTSKTINQKQDLVSREIERGNTIFLDIGNEDLKDWKSVSKEGALSMTTDHVKFGEKALKYKVKIDYKHDGGGEKGNYPIGWPRIAILFKNNTLDLTKYDYLSLWMWVDSDRDEVADDYTSMYLNISSWEEKAARFIFQTNILGDIEQREWIPINIPISSIIPKNSSRSPYKNIQRIQIGISENKYADNTSLTFYLDRIAFIKMKKPVIKSSIFPVAILLPATSMIVETEVAGVNEPNNENLTISILDADSNTITSSTVKLQAKNKVLLNVAEIKPGAYTIETKIGSGGAINRKALQALAGPF